MIAKSWFGRCWQWQIGGCVAIVGVLCVGVCEHVLAQIVPDNTLGAEGSVVTPDVIKGIQSDRIDGGATRGANLFQSFQEFNVGAGRGAYFTNPVGIENILTRVTGANRSDIFGRLGVDGDANLFLINPNGIVFGQDASLDVEGSFLATTADGVKLGDTGLFSASQLTTSNLLTVSPSALWFNAVAAQPIVNRSQAPSPFDQPNSNDGSPGLQVQPDRTLALIGGDMLLEGGNLTAAGGRIELGSVAGVGQVSLTQTGNSLVLGYDEINEFGNISLSNEVFVDASGEGGGDIQIRGARLEMTQSSNIWADTLGAENGGGVLVHATKIELSENSSLRTNVTDTGTGTGGDLNIDTGRLLVRDGAQVSASTSSPDSSGIGGNLRIYATQSIDLNQASLLTQSTGAAPAGNITIKASNIRLFGDSDITTNVNSGVRGNGNIDLDVDSIIAFDDSNILTYTRDGKGGDINVSARVWFVRVSNQNYRSLTELPLPDNQINQINTDSLLVNSCIVRRNQPSQGSFFITGTGGLPQRPGDAQMSSYPTVDIETLPSDDTSSTTNPHRPWQKGDPIVEPQGVYRLPNGNLVLSRECSGIQ